MAIPKSLFKFESFGNQSISNLKNSLIYFSKPFDFNDPFDCSITEESTIFSNEQILMIHNRWLAEGIYSKKMLEEFNNEGFSQEHIDSLSDGIRIALKSHQHKILHELGCTCFSKINTNILMWSHYADGHTGFCIEFDTSYEPFNKCYKVEYSDTFPKLNVSTVLNGECTDDELFSPLLTKYTDWDYEKEWRAFHSEGSNIFYYPIESVKSIYFGAAMNPTHIEIICLIMQGQNEHIKFYRGSKCLDKFELKFEEVFYTSYVRLNK